MQVFDFFWVMLLARNGTRSANFLLFYEGSPFLRFLRSGALGFGMYIFEVGRDLQNFFFCLVFRLVSGYDDSDYDKANHTHNYHHFQVLQPEFPLEFAGLLFEL